MNEKELRRSDVAEKLLHLGFIDVDEYADIKWFKAKISYKLCLQLLERIERLELETDFEA